MSIFFFATLVYSRWRTFWENISRSTYQDKTSESELDSSRPSWTPSPGSCFRLRSLIFPGGKPTGVQWSLLMSEERKWGCSHWFKHVPPLWNVSLLLMLFVTVLTVLISIDFFFYFIWCCSLLLLFVWHNNDVIIRTGVFFMPVVPGWETRTGGLSSADFTEPRTVQLERKLRSGREQRRFRSHRSTLFFIPWLPFFSFSRDIIIQL